MIDTLIVILLVVLGLCGVGLGGYWAAVGYHIGRTMALIPTARRGLSLPVPAEALPRVCVIVPAHNEESCIGVVAGSLARQDYPADRLRLVFVLDRCTDRTRAVLEETLQRAAPMDRAEIIELTECTPGWIGKPHALWSAANRAKSAADADVLLFVDADTELDARLVRATSALMVHRGLGFLSLLSTLTYDHWFETVVQPAAGMELMRQFPIVKANGGAERGTRAGSERRRPFANGQYIMVRREDYQRAGGHEAVRATVLEDVELARRADKSGVVCGFFLDGGMLRCRMYDSYAALRRGWKRIYSESANVKPQRLRKMARRVRLLGTCLPAGAAVGLALGLWFRGSSHDALAGIVWTICAAGLCVWAGVLVWSYRIGRIPLIGLPAFAVGSWITGSIMREAARDLERGKPTEWGGLKIDRSAR